MEWVKSDAIWVENDTRNPKVFPEDEEALALFKKYERQYHLDEGGEDERYRNAARMTRDLFAGTMYFVYVQEYCCYCSVSRLLKATDPRDCRLYQNWRSIPDLEE